MSRLQAREGKLSLLLLVLMLLSIAWAMELAGWVEGLYVAEWAVLGGLAMGFLLTRTRWPRLLSHLVSALAGGFLVLGAMTRFVAPSLGWADGLSLLAHQFDVWLRIVQSGQASTDPVMFVLLMTTVGWWLGYASAWMVFGAHKVWQALGLTGGAMLLVVYGSPPKVVPFFVLYLFCALLLAVRLHVFIQEVSWENDNARYDQDIGLHFLRDGGLLVAVVLIAVWIVPLLSSSSFLSDAWTRIGGPWRAAGDEWNRLFPGIQGYRQDYENIPFGQQLALGGPVELGDEIVMWVETEGGRYWRGAVYDLYDGTGWQNTDDLNATIAADKHLPRDGEYELRYAVVQTVVPNWSGVGQVFGIGQPASVDVPLEIQYSFTDVGAEDGRDPLSAPATVSLIKSRIPLNRERPYTVVSSASMADVRSLRAAEDTYPAWVASRYLQLPDTLPERVVELAEEIAVPYDNVYDKAVALQEYLRRTIEYDEDIDRPPADRDAIDYLLFDSRTGYCNYYASAMVVMARSLGIPSRLAVGYVGGELDDETGVYTVRERDTHAWVEVYFPRYGWVEFEPTASEEPISRPDASDEAGMDRLGGDVDSRLERDLDRLKDDLEDVGDPAVIASSRRESSRAFAVLAGLLLTVAVVAGASWVLKRRGVDSGSAVRSIYRRMCIHGRVLGVRGEASQTPYEYATVLAARVPHGAEQVEQIAALYVRDRFAVSGAGVAEEQEAEGAWRALRPLMWREFVRRVPAFVRSRVPVRRTRRLTVD